MYAQSLNRNTIDVKEKKTYETKYQKGNRNAINHNFPLTTNQEINSKQVVAQATINSGK